ncbi:DUF4132 domain-containing protein [Flavobacterium sp. C3NV]|uniref:DUF4132 domain-containing protein n=1 Tax=Flavobacterium sp. C3NV TaxID=3393358 RepID=UPI00398FFBDB
MSFLDKIKNIINKKSEVDPNEDLFWKLITDIAKNNQTYYSVDFKKLSTYQEILKFNYKQKVEIILFLIEKKHQHEKFLKAELRLTHIINDKITSLVKEKISYDEMDIYNIITAFITHKNKDGELPAFIFWSVNQFVTKVASQYKGKELNYILKTVLEDLKNDSNLINAQYYDKAKFKIIEKIDSLLFESENGSDSVKPVLFFESDVLSDYANLQIENLPEEEKILWYKILTEARKATGAKPSDKFLKETKNILDQLSIEKFKQLLNEWMTVTIQSKDEIPEQEYFVGTFTLSLQNTDMLKGLVWMCSHFNDSQTIYKISKLAERCYQKIPNKGPAAAGLGNACLFTLYKTEGLEGISQLSRLKLRIKQNNTQTLIEKYLYQAAEEQGISIYEIEDLAADDFDLSDGKRTWLFDDYKAEISLLNIGKVETKWIKPDEKLQKTVPTFVKEKFGAEFTALKNIAKQVEQNSSSQRDRIDRMFRSGRKMPWQHFDTYYFSHGLISFIAKKIIWIITENDTSVSAIWIDNSWRNSANEVLNPSKNSFVSLWHPSLETIKDVTDWRNFLIENKIQQPIKQAFREVYLLTEAEINTKNYSNRMAAHILKQHQFNILAKTRGWKYSLMGSYDDGRENESAEIILKEHNLRAEFWVSEVNADNQFNDAGIWNYVATDQVRFENLANNEPIDLINVPARVFSEIMRDVDLFVGVASVGNDPTWQDTGGVPAYRDYWQSYSFGDLSEVAKMRKDILTNLVPRLKINKIAEVKDKFLVVQGKLRTYKIHIGSTNILMEPNDQYLCIVPDRSAKNHTDNLFLPFEGDSGLSIILSKAFLLADDDKITDSTITSQINQK